MTNTIKKMETNYYEKILGVIPENSSMEYSTMAVSMFHLCREYYWYYKIYSEIVPVMNTLKNYVDDEYCFSRHFRKKKSSKLKIDELLYVEFIVDLYLKYHKDTYSWGQLRNEDILDEIIHQHYKDIDNVTFSDIKYTMSTIYDSDSNYIKIDLTKFHKAMQVLKNALKMPIPPIDISVEKVISEEWLFKIYNYYKNDDFPGARFTITPITMALRNGAYHNHLTGSRKAYFNLQCDYNLEELKNHIDTLKKLMKSYEDTKEEIANLK